MTALFELLLGNLLPVAVGFAALLAGFWGYGKKKERDGRRKEHDEQEEASNRLVEKLHEVDADIDPDDAVEYLRRRKRR